MNLDGIRSPGGGNMTHTGRVVVIGAGYTGMLAAIGVAQRAKRQARVTLVNPIERFTERLRMHQIATGQQLAKHHIPELLAGTGIGFVQGSATSIGTDARIITLSTMGGQTSL